MVRLADFSQVELRLNLPQAAAASFRVGGRVAARFEAGAAQVSATGLVNFVSPLADSASGLVDVRIRFDNPNGRIRPGAKAVIRSVAASS
jgi:multidrug efflux pump subunit AcrA (membrane-fusion protein)